jgi:alkanesulfonate monooxygenase SsuD/methylene tetrahydromethanopterin reductase-like flavin-dependent oxidoreductase (luciferase family)
MGQDGPMTTIGTVFLPQFPPERLREVARAADESGLDELWLWEDCFLESGVATAAAVLAWTQRVRVAVGLLPVPLRNVAITAMELATLERLFPGRATMAIGHGVQDWMGQVGARPASPLTLLREYATALRALLDGETVTTSGRYVALSDVALDWPPPGPSKIVVGATGPKTLQLAGEVADGTILTGGTGPAGVRAARELIDAGRRAAGRTGPHQMIVYLLAATGTDAAPRLAAALDSWGYDPALDVGVAGDEHAVAAAVGRWVDAGADTVVLQPTPDEPDPAGFVRFVGDRVAPLVR